MMELREHDYTEQSNPVADEIYRNSESLNMISSVMMMRLSEEKRIADSLEKIAKALEERGCDE